MSEAIIAKRYAAAMIAAADDAGAELQSLIDELRPWAEWLNSGDDGATALLSPVLSPDKQAAFLKVLLDQSETGNLVHGLLRVCLDKRRLPLLNHIVAGLETERDVRSGAIKGRGISALPLDDELKQQIATKIGTMLNKTADLDWDEDPSLLGGFRIELGHTILDASMQHQLNRLQESIRKGV